MQNQLVILINKHARFPNLCKVILEDSNERQCELDKILGNFCFDHNFWFSVVFENYASMCSVPLLIHN